MNAETFSNSRCPGNWPRFRPDSAWADFTTYHASAEAPARGRIARIQQKWEMTAQIQSLMLKNQELQEKTAAPPPVNTPPAPPPAATYLQPPAPPPPPAYGTAGAPREPAQSAAPPSPNSLRDRRMYPCHPMEPRLSSDWEGTGQPAPGGARGISLGPPATCDRRYVARARPAYGDDRIELWRRVVPGVCRGAGAAFAEADWLVPRDRRASRPAAGFRR